MSCTQAAVDQIGPQDALVPPQFSNNCRHEVHNTPLLPSLLPKFLLANNKHVCNIDNTVNVCHRQYSKLRPISPLWYGFYSGHCCRNASYRIHTRFVKIVYSAWGGNVSPQSPTTVSQTLTLTLTQSGRGTEAHTHTCMYLGNRGSYRLVAWVAPSEHEETNNSCTRMRSMSSCYHKFNLTVKSSELWGKLT